MAQRASGYERKPDEHYATVAWPVVALLSHLGPIRRAWDPCARGDAKLVAILRAHGIDAVGTARDFFTFTQSPIGVDILATNPPYGKHRRGEMAVRFIEHALRLTPRVVMLLRADFDSAIGRQHLFRHNPSFAFKLVLLNRIKWFAGPSNPSDNHAWFGWDRSHIGPPTIRYMTRAEAEHNMLERYDAKQLQETPA
jgi:hypothetical protein